MSRPEWVHCIKRDHVNHTTWCGNPEHEYGFLLQGLEHAAALDASGSRLQACPECVSKAVTNLLASTWRLEER